MGAEGGNCGAELDHGQVVEVEDDGGVTVLGFDFAHVLGYFEAG